MREQIARTARFNRVSWQKRTRRIRRSREKRQQGECNEREERENNNREIIVKITYEFCAEETGEKEIEEWERLGEEEVRAQLFPRDFLIIYRARVFLSFVARE